MKRYSIHAAFPHDGRTTTCFMTGIRAENREHAIALFLNKEHRHWNILQIIEEKDSRPSLFG